ncbi:MAG: PHP domain-containing protein [Prevotellaceae bacterium]|jgi:PHP family Zn ribbon phosphoesterase|nr:PHP domain-containing protein [Prevotellaceae bacterium]
MPPPLALFRADLHIHTTLSPCGDLEMTPRTIIAKAKERQLDLIGVCDHNTTRQCAEIQKVGRRENIFVLCGAEVTTREEIHCLAFFETPETLADFQRFLDDNLPPVPNNVEQCGHQLLVDEDERILHAFPYWLPNALTKTIDEVAAKVRRLNGLFIPAHIDKARNSLLSQLGFVPPDLPFDALELAPPAPGRPPQTPLPAQPPGALIWSSDAHCPDEIGRASTELRMKEPSFKELKYALQHGHITKSIDRRP